MIEAPNPDQPVQTILRKAILADSGFHTVIRYQIVDWDPNNPHHPRYLAGHILIKSLFRRNHYYWIACSNPLPKDNTKKAPPAITFSPPTSAPSSALVMVQPTNSSSLFESNFEKAQPLAQGQHAASVSSPTLSHPSNLAPAENNLPTIGMNSGSKSPSDINYAHSHPLPTRSNVSPLSLPPADRSFGSSATASPSTDQNARPDEYSSPVSSPDVPRSQKKRTSNSNAQKGRNVRQEQSRHCVQVEGRVEKPAEGWLNLGTFSWHYGGSSDGSGKS